ncbi:Tudor Domain-Containing Protein 6 [Manis pentadactyla]|nr:Tudor Domain-Containing Protein 6 [Manis pentadactyla]
MPRSQHTVKPAGAEGVCDRRLDFDCFFLAGDEDLALSFRSPFQQVVESMETPDRLLLQCRGCNSPLLTGEVLPALSWAGCLALLLGQRRADRGNVGRCRRPSSHWLLTRKFLMGKMRSFVTCLSEYPALNPNVPQPSSAGGTEASAHLASKYCRHLADRAQPGVHLGA